MRPLSSGGGGTLWVAAHMRMHTQVAVKFLAGHLMSDPKSRARFLREARLASEIDSPHLVHTYDTGLLADETPYIVMEWLEGESLKQRIKREGRLHPAEAASVVAQVAKALTRTHEAGVVHRDIKADNVFLLRSEGAPLVKVLDFGVAKRLPHSDEDLSVITAVDETLGTPAYMSPEQLRRAHEVDHRTDIWSLGVLAYLLLMGILPFAAEDYPTVCLLITEGRYFRPSTVDRRWPPTLDAWLGRTLAVDRDRRFYTAAEAADAFLRAVAELGSEWPAGYSEGASPWHDGTTHRRPLHRPQG
ncbi:MAG: serine/threonine-protein kinase [Polyangiaceae bacterium]